MFCLLPLDVWDVWDVSSFNKMAHPGREQDRMIVGEAISRVAAAAAAAFIPQGLVLFSPLPREYH